MFKYANKTVSRMEIIYILFQHVNVSVFLLLLLLLTYLIQMNSGYHSAKAAKAHFNYAFRNEMCNKSGCEGCVKTLLCMQTQAHDCKAWFVMRH